MENKRDEKKEQYGTYFCFRDASATTSGTHSNRKRLHVEEYVIFKLPISDADDYDSILGWTRKLT